LKKLTFVLLPLAWGCCYENVEGAMNFAKRSQITPLSTTTNALGSFAGNSQPNLQINDLEPGEYTLQFQVVEPTIDGFVNGGVRAYFGSATYAIVHWKVGGQQIRRVISVFSGAVLGGVAEAVDVQLLDQSARAVVWPVITAAVVPGSPTVTFTLPVFFGGNELISFTSQPGVFYSLAGPVSGTVTVNLTIPYSGPVNPATTIYVIAPYKIGVALSKGTRPTIMQPPVLTTSRILAVPSGSSSAAISIPIDAGIISILATVTVDGAPPTNQAQASNGVIVLLNPTLAGAGRFIPQQFPLWYPVPPDSNFLLLENHSATDALDFSFQWGIEG
jgi:hypothetical protein